MVAIAKPRRSPGIRSCHRARLIIDARFRRPAFRVGFSSEGSVPGLNVRVDGKSALVVQTHFASIAMASPWAVSPSGLISSIDAS